MHHENLEEGRALYAAQAAHSHRSMWNDVLAMPGGILQGQAEDVWGLDDSEAKVCCGALQCFGCCYAMDLCCTIPTMRTIEEGDNRLSLSLFAFYECCWPCMCCFSACFGKEKARSIPRAVPYMHTFDDHMQPA